MRYAESFGISGLWVVTLFHALPAIAILPFVAHAYIADRQHRLMSFIAGGLMDISFVLLGLGLVVASGTKPRCYFISPRYGRLYLPMWCCLNVLGWDAGWRLPVACWAVYW